MPGTSLSDALRVGDSSTIIMSKTTDILSRKNLIEEIHVYDDTHASIKTNNPATTNDDIILNLNRNNHLNALFNINNSTQSHIHMQKDKNNDINNNNTKTCVSKLVIHFQDLHHHTHIKYLDLSIICEYMIYDKRLTNIDIIANFDVLNKHHSIYDSKITCGYLGICSSTSNLIYIFKSSVNCNADKQFKGELELIHEYELPVGVCIFMTISLLYF